MLGVSRPIYVNVDSPNLGFPYFNFLGGVPVKKHPVSYHNMIYIMWDRCHHFANQNISGMHTIYSIHPWYAIYYILYAKLTGMHTPGPDGEYAGGSGDHEYLFFGQWSWSNGAKKVSKSVQKQFEKVPKKKVPKVSP